MARGNRRQPKGRKTSGGRSSAGQDGMGTVNVPRLLKRGDQMVMKTVRSYQLAQIDSNATTDVLKGYNFYLAALPNITQFTNLYDEYRIDAIEITMVPNLTNISNATPQNFHMGTMITAIDYNSSAAPANVSALLSYETAIIHGAHTPGKSITRKWVPSARIAAYDTSPGFTSGAVKQLQWFDTAYPNVEHFGLVLGLVNGDSSLNFSYFLYFTAWLSFRKVV